MLKAEVYERMRKQIPPNGAPFLSFSPQPLAFSLFLMIIRAFIRLHVVSAFIEFRRDKSARQEGEL
jgi:hypothetical protein